MLAADGCFALLFGAFGAVTGAICWRQGQASGTLLGLAVARAFDRARGQALSPTVRGALTGGADGAAFGLVIGTAVGLVVGWRTPAEWRLFRPLVLATAALACAALAFGLFAGVMTLRGTRGTLGLFLGAIPAALVGFTAAGLDGLLVGAVAGAALGAFLSPRTGPPRDP